MEEMESKPTIRNYWDFIASTSTDAGREDLWRAYLKEVYRELKTRWRDSGRIGRGLKTDLYDEAVSRHALLSLFEGECEHFVGADVSFAAALAAKRQLTGLAEGRHQIAVSDARKQAFKSQIFDTVFSNSTLDHFSNRSDLLASLGELHRIIQRGGRLLITLDNPQNPVVWLRNRFPYALLKHIGIIPYYMGVTLSRFELVRALESEGFRVCGSTVIVHSPRILTIWAGYFLGRLKSERLNARFLRLLRFFERLERLPTKHLTGYYVAVKAIKI
jgi:SAM-dependent methyltransferase